MINLRTTLFFWITLIICVSPLQVSAAPVYADWTPSGDFFNVAGNIDGVGVTISSPTQNGYVAADENYSGFSNPHIYSTTLDNTDAIGSFGTSGGADYVFDFDGVIENPIIYLASLASVLEFDPEVSINKISGGSRLEVINNQVIGYLDTTVDIPNTDGNAIIQLNGSFSSISFSATTVGSAMFDEFALQIGSESVTAAVPEPTGILLLGLGLLGLVSFRRKDSSV